MNYYKIIMNGTVVDANHVYLKYQKKHQVMIGCDPEEAQFIQSSDQNTLWTVPWLNKPPTEAGEFKAVEAVEITEDEYAELRVKLDLGETVDEATDPTEPVTPSEDEPEALEPNETVMTSAEMRISITSLKEQLQAETERNDFMEACILEMSEIVYD